MPPWPAFVGGSAQSVSPAFQNARTVNFFVEHAQSDGAKSPAALLPTPGFQSWATVPDSVGRGAYFESASQRLFIVVGGTLYEFDVNGTATNRGSVKQDANPAQIVYNGHVGGQLLISSGGNAYCFVLSSNAFSEVLTGKATMIAYCEGYFLAFELGTGKVYLSALNDGTTWSLGNFFQRSQFADPWQSMFVDGNNLVWLPGSATFEVWSLSNPSSTQPFAPLSGLVGEYGIAAPFAFAVAGSPFWIHQNAKGAGSLVQATGSGVQSVTPYAVANTFSKYARTAGIGDAELMPYQDEGHTFLVPSFPKANATWAYDITGGKDGWAERGEWNPMTGVYDLWSPRTHVYAYGKHLVGDRTSGTIWQMDATFATERSGAGIRRLRMTSGLYFEDARAPYHQLLLKCRTGIGLQGTGQGSAPLWMLRVSRDGGMTWGNERTASMGAIGVFRQRVYWNRLGLNEDCAVELTCSDPVSPSIVNAYVNPTAAEAA